MRLTAVVLATTTVLLPRIAHAQQFLPDAPEPQGLPLLSPAAQNTQAPDTSDASANPDAGAPAPSQPRQASLPSANTTYQRPTTPGFPPVSVQGRARPSYAPLQDPEVPSRSQGCLPNLSSSDPSRMCCTMDVNPFYRFVESSYLHPLTPKEKGYLAFRNTVDPFNFLTISFFSALDTSTNSHSAYGPGWKGFGHNIGVAYTETAVGEFFGTFLIPAVTHQDPHYHRIPNASVTRRIFHAIEQVAWTESDYGQGMPNYSNLVGTAVTDSLGDLYVPGRQAGFDAGAARWVTAVATSPISNFITEFLPDVARHVNVRIVLVQRVINQVERQNGGG